MSWGWRMLRLKPKMTMCLGAILLCLGFMVHERHTKKMVEAGAQANVNIITALGMKSTASFVLPNEKTTILEPVEKKCEVSLFPVT